MPNIYILKFQTCILQILTFTSSCRYKDEASSHCPAIFSISSCVNPCTFLAAQPCIHNKHYQTNNSRKIKLCNAESETQFSQQCAEENTHTHTFTHIPQGPYKQLLKCKLHIPISEKKTTKHELKNITTDGI